MISLRSMFLLLFLFVVLVPLPAVQGAPFLLGNQMASLSVIPRTEEQAAALLQFLENNPQYGSTVASQRSNSTSASRQIQVNREEVIFVTQDQVNTLSNGLQDIGLRYEDSTNAYQMFETS